ncbi:hypothetical protein JCM3774_005490 [Rhodotorula dairenensis]
MVPELQSDAKAPPVPTSQQYTVAYKEHVYNSTQEFCTDWDSSCVEYLSTFSDIHQVICDVGAPGPNVQVYCGGNTVLQPHAFYDFTNNVQRFVSASMISGPESYGEPTNGNSSSTSLGSLSTSSASSLAQTPSTSTSVRSYISLSDFLTWSHVTSLAALNRNRGIGFNEHRRRDFDDERDGARSVDSHLDWRHAVAVTDADADADADADTVAVTHAGTDRNFVLRRGVQCYERAPYGYAERSAERDSYYNDARVELHVHGHVVNSLGPSSERDRDCLSANRLRKLAKAKAAELARIAALRKKQLVQAIARTAERSRTKAAEEKKERAAAAKKAKEQARREAEERATKAAQQSHMAKQRKKKPAHSLSSLEKRLESKLGADGLR